MLPQLRKLVTWNPPLKDQPGPRGRGLLGLGLGCGRSPLSIPAHLQRDGAPRPWTSSPGQ